MRGMVINMNDEQQNTLADLQAFLTGTVAMDFTVTADQRYELIARTVLRFACRLRNCARIARSGCWLR